jgi:4'-phosphopantetheinyl transferase
MHEHVPARRPELSFTQAQELLLNVELERESGRQTACLFLIHVSQYAALSSQPEAVLHAEELKYFHSLSALKRKKDYLLGRYAAKRALLYLSQTASAPEIHIRPGVFQQPVVIGPACEELSACITHSGTFAAAIAFPTGHPLGIDLEWHDDAVLETLKQHVETPELPPTELCASEAERYIRVWTVKESLSKILQCGLTTPFSVLKLRADPVPNGRAWSGEFENFSQYRFISLSSPKLSLALVHPRRTKVMLPIEQIINFAS